MGVQKLDENLSLYSKDNLTTLYNDVSGNSDSLMSYAKEGSRTKIRDFGQEYLKKVVENFDHNGVMKEKPNQNMDFGNINKKDEKEVIKVRTDFFQDYFLPFLKNPGDMKTEISLEEYEQVGNQKDEWISCFGKDKKDEEVKKSLEYRDEWYEFSKKEIRRIIEKSGGKKKDKPDNDSYGDHEEVFSKDDRYEAAKKRIEKMSERYKKDKNNNYDILNDNKEDYSTMNFLEGLKKFFTEEGGNPLGGDSNLQKFLDANFSQLKKVLGGLEGKKSLGSKGSSEEDCEDDEGEEEENLEGDGEENYLKNLQKEASSDKASKKVKEIYNVKKVLLQYLFDMANMDLDFCYGKVKICSEGSESEENNDKENEEDEDEDENENPDNGIFSKISIGLKMGSEYIKGKLQQGYGTLIKNFYDIDSYDNYCGFLVKMISNLGNQIEDIGAVNVSSKDNEEEEQKGDKNKNDKNSASGNERVKKEIFYDPYWYIDYLSKSEGEEDHKNAEKLKNYYLERAKLIKLYEYLGDEKNFNPKKSLESIIPSSIISGFKAPKAPEAPKVELLNASNNSSNDTNNASNDTKMKVPTLEEIKTKRILSDFNVYSQGHIRGSDIYSLLRNSFINDNTIIFSKFLSDISKEIKEKIQKLESKIKDKIKEGKQKCENKNEEDHGKEIKILASLSEMNEFSDNKKEFSEMSFISKDDYFKSTAEQVLSIDKDEDKDKSFDEFHKSAKELKEKIFSVGKYFEYNILSKQEIEKVTENINEKNFPMSYDKIDPKFDKYFDDNSEFLIEFLTTEKEKEEKKKKAEEEKKKAEREKKNAERKKKNAEKKEGRNKIYEAFGVKLKSIYEEKEKIVEEAGKKGTLEGFWEYLVVEKEDKEKIDKINNKEEIFDQSVKKHSAIQGKIFENLKKKHPGINMTDDLKKAICEGLQEKYDDLEDKQEEENRKKEEEKMKKEIVEEAGKKGTLKEFWEHLGIKDISKKDISKKEEIYKKLIEKYPNMDKKQYEQIYEGLQKKYNDLKNEEAEKAKARSTPKGFLKYLAENFLEVKVEGVNVMTELKNKLVHDKEKYANAEKFKKMYEALEKHYEKLVQQEAEKAAEAFKKSTEGEATPKKLLRDFYTPKESYKIENLLFTDEEHQDDRISYAKYPGMAGDKNPTPKKYLSFLGMQNIDELEAVYKKIGTYSNLNIKKYEDNLEYYQNEYKDALNKYNSDMK